jgi:hypothetical protein
MEIILLLFLPLSGIISAILVACMVVLILFKRQGKSIKVPVIVTVVFVVVFNLLACTFAAVLLSFL